MSAAPEAIEPVVPHPPYTGFRTLLTQGWHETTFLHWPVEAEAVAPLLPRGTIPDTLDGVTYVGLVAFRMYRTGVLGLPGLPVLGSFPETNVRLYSVDARGRRGVVFRSLDAARLPAVLAGRGAFGLAYAWSAMAVRRRGELLEYTCRRRWPDRAARSRITVRPGAPVERPTAFEEFVTARWRLHTTVRGTPTYLPNAHPRWPLHRAELVECTGNLLAAAGVHPTSAQPVSVLYSPGVPVRFGAPVRV